MKTEELLEDKMNEIEKMYENAGISKEVIPCPAKYYGYNCTRNNWDDADCSCDIEGYPPFTAEKQIELIKWLGKLVGKLEISSNYNDTQYLAYFYLNRKTRDEILPNISTGRNENFAQCLAGLIINLWQDLTEEERKQIKNILELEVSE